jgi:hypothetical protein
MYHHPVIREAIANEVRRERERRYHWIERIRPRRDRQDGGPGSGPGAASGVLPAAIPRAAGPEPRLSDRPRAV